MFKISTFKVNYLLEAGTRNNPASAFSILLNLKAFVLATSDKTLIFYNCPDYSASKSGINRREPNYNSAAILFRKKKDVLENRWFYGIEMACLREFD